MSRLFALYIFSFGLSEFLWANQIAKSRVYLPYDGCTTVFGYEASNLVPAEIERFARVFSEFSSLSSEVIRFKTSTGNVPRFKTLIVLRVPKDPVMVNLLIQKMRRDKTWEQIAPKSPSKVISDRRAHWIMGKLTHQFNLIEQRVADSQLANKATVALMLTIWPSLVGILLAQYDYIPLRAMGVSDSFAVGMMGGGLGLLFNLARGLGALATLSAPFLSVPQRMFFTVLVGLDVSFGVIAIEIHRIIATRVREIHAEIAAQQSIYLDGLNVLGKLDADDAVAIVFDRTGLDPLSRGEVQDLAFDMGLR